MKYMKNSMNETVKYFKDSGTQSHKLISKVDIGKYIGRHKLK